MGVTANMIFLAVATSGPAIGTPTACDRVTLIGGGCDLVVVTAERRPAELASIPMSVDLIQANDLEVLRIQTSRDLDSRVPNLSAQPGVVNGGAALFSIRGIVTSGDETLGLDNPIGLYVDGVPLPRAAAATLDLVDIDSVEVLRGPQGSLFGRNTTGGAISLVSHVPAPALGATLRLEGGTRGWREARARIDAGELTPGLRLSVAGLRRERHGFVDNLLEPRRQRDPGGGEEAALRLAAVVDIDNQWRISASADWSRMNGTPWASQTAVVGTGMPRPPIEIDGRRVAPAQPAPVARWIATATPGEPRCFPGVGVARARSLCLPDARPSEDEHGGVLLRLDGQLSGLSLRVTTAWRGWRNRFALADLDGLPSLTGFALTPDTLLAGVPAEILRLIPGVGDAEAATLAATQVPLTNSPIFASGNRRVSDQWSQELELRSPDDAPLRWVIGAIAIGERGRERSLQRIGAVVDVVDSVLAPSFGSLAPLLAAGLPDGTRVRLLAQPDALLSYRVRNRSFALFGQVDARLPGTPELGVGVGLRLTHDVREIGREQNGPAPFTAAERAQNRRRIGFTRPTGHIAIDWRPADTAIGWIRLARGYQAGGWNARQPTRLASAGEPEIALQPFLPQTVLSAELGWRWSSPVVRLSGAIFLTRERNARVVIPIADAPTFGTVVTNAGRVDRKGAELAAAARLSPQLRIEANLGYTDTKFRRYPTRAEDGALVDIASWIRPGNTPRWTGAASIIGSAPLQGRVRLDARLSWTGRARLSFFADPIAQPFIDTMSGKALHRIDADLRLGNVALSPDIDATIALWAENLGKRRPVRGVDFAQLGVGTLIYSEPPRVGLTVSLRTWRGEAR